MKTWKIRAAAIALLLFFGAVVADPQWDTSKTGRQPLVNRLCLDTSGSGTVQSCTTTPTFVPAAGDSIIYETTTTNTGDLTINVNGAGAVHARKWQASATLAAGDLVAGVYMLATYDGTYWEFYTIGNAPAGAGAVQVVYSTPSASTDTDIAPVTMVTAGGSGNMYRFDIYLDQTAVGVGCTLTTGVIAGLTFTDPNAGGSATVPANVWSISGNGAAGNYKFPSEAAGSSTNLVFRQKASTAVQYLVTVTPDVSCGTKPTYQAYPILMQLN